MRAGQRNRRRSCRNTRKERLRALDLKRNLKRQTAIAVIHSFLKRKNGTSVGNRPDKVSHASWNAGEEHDCMKLPHIKSSNIKVQQVEAIACLRRGAENMIPSFFHRTAPVIPLYGAVIGIAYTLLFTGVCYGAERQSLLSRVVASIRHEATMPNFGPEGRPLPLAGHWNTGDAPDGFSPSYQLNLIEKGHHLLPWFSLPPPNSMSPFFLKPFKRVAQLGLPMSFISTQWERLLSDEKRYFTLPPKQNPNLLTLSGRIVSKVSPFGPVKPWREVGTEWTKRNLVKRLQEVYPNPPLVLFISNNEHRKLQWPEVASSLRYRQKYPGTHSDDFKRKVVGDGWITRYRALQDGMRNGLINSSWENVSRFIGYGSVGLAAFGRWGGWTNSVSAVERTAAMVQDIQG